MRIKKPKKYTFNFKLLEGLKRRIVPNEQAKYILKFLKDNPYIIAWDNPKVVEKYKELREKYI